jgi:WD40 repeat protein
LWNYAKKEPVAVLKGIQVGVKTLAFSPDDRYLAALGENNTFIIWDTRDGSAIHTRVYEFPLSVVAWGDILTDQNPKHPSYIIVTANQTNVFINSLEFDISSMQYYLKQGTCQLPNTGLNRTYTFSRANGDTLLLGTTGGEICIFSIYNRIYRATMPLSSNGLLCLTMVDDFLFVGGGDGKVKKLSISGGRWVMSHEAQLDSKVVSINVSADKKELIVGTNGGKLYRMLTTDLSFMLHTDAHTGTINDLNFGKRSDQFLSIDDNGSVKMWDLSEYKSLFTGVVNKNSKGSSCCIAGDDGSIVTGWRDGFVRCFEGTGRVMWEISGAHRGSVTSLYCDANYLLSGGEDGAVRVWSRTNRKLLIQFNGKKIIFKEPSLTIDQKKDIVGLFPDLQKPYLIHSCSMDRSISTYDLKQEKRIGGHQTKNGALYGMTQRRDNEYELVSCGQGAPIYFWDCDAPNPVAEIQYPYKALSISVSPSGRFVAYGTETNEVFVYSISGLNQFTFLTKGLGHSGPVTKVKWSPDEKQIISVSTDSSISIWNFYGAA